MTGKTELVRALVACALLLPAAGHSAEADQNLDEIVLKNGSRILGTVIELRDGIVKIKTDFAGVVKIHQDQIQDMQTRTPTVIKLADGTLLEDQAIVVQQEQLLLSGPEAPMDSYTVRDVVLGNPKPWELGHGYLWSGLVSTALTLERGNTDSDEFDYRLESVWRSLRDRYTVRLNGEIDEANDQKIAENWAVLGKYDHFLEGPLYWGLNASVEQDKFADLDRRYYLGPYLGRQFYEAPALTLSGEIGLVYVDEQFILGEDGNYRGMNWTVDATSNYLGGNSRLYLEHTGIWNLDQTEDMLLNLTMGLAFPLLFNVEAAAEVVLEHDSGRPPDVEELDQTYRFRLGYSW
ncbi:DUF481 domain-containing protein [Kineobactrum salinum]|uniref:DUF481 domain-containing protein n=1 Tax=Kineobactrum salinum TaxID=2708301 RepID=A0A6C0U7F4_9GAMM|nr:DUF481 domain-containing protein [Kineobactrum salinum]QIB65424.1 DUF481 domain-containing protein [Kineobactrum salinum]